jgi:uroporphyrinogen decarboxylase
MSTLTPPRRRKTMTGQERVTRAFTGQPADSVPRYESFWGETITRWENEGLIGERHDVLNLLDCDLESIGWNWPKCFPGTQRTVSQDRETRVVINDNGQTLRFWRGRSGTPEHLGFGCQTREDWEQTYKPGLLRAGLQVDPHAAARTFGLARQKGRWTCLVGVEGFEATRALMGDEITLIAMADDPEWVRDVSVAFTDQVLRNFDAVMATGIQPDGVWIYGDMAFKHATMCSPTMYKDLIWPDHKRLADWAHAHRMKFIYHTDGDVNGVMDLYLQAGFDCLQPLEAKANMDIRKLCPRYGDRMTFFGNVDVMVLATNDRDKIEQEVSQKLKAGMATRRYIYHSDHSVPPSVSWDTYRYVIELLDKYGNYD